jgi:hypothetical protein
MLIVFALGYAAFAVFRAVRRRGHRAR